MGPKGDNTRVLAGLSAGGAALMLLAFGWPLVQGEIYLEHDISANFVPLRYFFAQCLQQGESFLWIPNIHSGFYLHGDGQNGMSHPLHLFLYSNFSFTTALDLEFILSYPFMFAGVVLFLRRLQLPGPSVLFGAMLFTFSGYCMSSWLWLVHIAVIAHTPWTLWAIHIVMRSEKPREIVLASFAIVLLTASSLLVGYPQMVYVMGMAEGLFALSLLRGCRNRWMLGLLFSAKCFGLMAAAIQLLPTLDLLQQSTRNETSDVFRSEQSLHPLNLLCLVNPYLFQQRMFDGNGYQGIYGGTSATLMVAWLLLRIRKLEVSRWLVGTCAVMALVGLLLTLGKYAYLYTWISSLPLISSFRGPPRHGAMFHAGWVMLATLALTELLHLRRNALHVSWRELVPMFGLTALSIILAIFIVVLRLLPEVPEVFAMFESESAPTRNPAMGAVIMSVTMGAFVAAARGWRYGMIALLLITMADLSWYGLRHRTTDTLDNFVAGIDVPPDDTAGYEPDWLPMYSVNAPLMKGDYRTPEGLVSLTPQKRINYMADPDALRLAGVGWIRSRLGTNEWLNEAYQEGTEWIPLENPMPRARLVTRTQVSDDFDRDIHEIDFETIALLEKALELPDGNPGTATILEEGPGRFRIRTTAESEQLLVLTESYSAGWQIESVGRSLEPIPVYGDFLGCVIEADTHEIELVFAPKSYRIGRLITWFSLLGALLMHGLLYWLLNRREAEKSIPE